MTRAAKDTEIEGLVDCFSRSKIALLADYRGMSVPEVTEFRAKLRDIGSEGKVVKNTLAKISVNKVYGENGSGESLEQFSALFEGPSFVVFSYEDMVAPAKVLHDFAKDCEALEVKGAWMDGEFVDAKGVEALSKMPSREELLSKLLSVINAPATQVARLLNAPGTQMVQLLGAYKDKLEKEAA